MWSTAPHLLLCKVHYSMNLFSISDCLVKKIPGGWRGGVERSGRKDLGLGGESRVGAGLKIRSQSKDIR